MNLMTLGIGFASMLTLSACCGLQQRDPNEKIASVSEVLNLVKDELNIYLASSPQDSPKPGYCYEGQIPMTLVPVNVTATLKTVATRTNEPSIGLSAPVGVVSFDPSFTGSYGASKAQTIQVALNVAPDEPKGNVKTLRSPTSLANGEHELAIAIMKLRDEVLRVDHDRTPCLAFGEKSSFKLTLGFNVTNKSTGGFALKLLTFKVGDKYTVANDYSQTLDLEFKLSTPMTLNIQ